MTQSANSNILLEDVSEDSAREESPSLAIASPESAIEVADVSVNFRAYESRPSSMKEFVLKGIREGKWRYYSTFEALKNISFQVERGTVFAIIGSNGAGKTTLLRTLAGVLHPEKGSLNIHGTVDSLIQLGAGFDPDLNAIENIYLNGSLHQKSRSEMKKRIDRILAFSELQEFSHTPIKYYSSGMSARLGFSVAIDRDPDILLVDEILAVGDERFQSKCDGVFKNFLYQKKTIVMVTHSMDQVLQMADKVLLLSRGEVAYCGDPEEAVRRYQSEEYQTRLSS